MLKPERAIAHARDRPLAPHRNDVKSGAMQSEQWVEAYVNVAAGAVEFSEPLTVEELEASRDQIVAHLNQSCGPSAPLRAPVPRAR